MISKSINECELHVKDEPVSKNPSAEVMDEEIGGKRCLNSIIFDFYCIFGQFTCSQALLTTCIFDP